MNARELAEALRQATLHPKGVTTSEVRQRVHDRARAKTTAGLPGPIAKFVDEVASDSNRARVRRSPRASCAWSAGWPRWRTNEARARRERSRLRPEAQAGHDAPSDG